MSRRKQLGILASIALVALFVLLAAWAVGVHRHDSPASACQVCHVVHLSALAPAVTTAGFVLLVLSWRRSEAEFCFATEAVLASFHSRAPPA
jgi:hypothetical protein